MFGDYFVGQKYIGMDRIIVGQVLGIPMLGFGGRGLGVRRNQGRQ